RWTEDTRALPHLRRRREAASRRRTVAPDQAPLRTFSMAAGRGAALPAASDPALRLGRLPELEPEARRSLAAAGRAHERARALPHRPVSEGSLRPLGGEPAPAAFALRGGGDPRARAVPLRAASRARAMLVRAGAWLPR